MRAFIKATIFAILAFLSFSCGDSEWEPGEVTPSSRFSGKNWAQLDEGTYTYFECYEFSSNGTYKYYYLKETSGTSYYSYKTGKWEAYNDGGDDQLKLTYDGLTRTYNVSSFIKGKTTSISTDRLDEYKNLVLDYYHYY